MLTRRRLLSLSLALVVPPGRAAEPAPSELVIVRTGTVPILITAPHGGQLAVPGVPARTRPADPPKGTTFNTDYDPETDRIALGIADRLKVLLGGEPYVVVARFHRRYIDANRATRIAFDHPASRPHYEAYHDAIRRGVDAIRAAHSNGVLLDIHGQHKLPDSLVRGTINGRTIKRLLSRAGDEAITGPKGLFGQFERNGFKVFPDNSLAIGGRTEDDGFNGGFTTNTYGSHRADGIDAIQCEFGIEYRRRARLPATIEAAAQSIATFVQTSYGR